MKKLLAIVLLVIFCTAALAEGDDLTSLVRSRGLDPVAAQGSGSILRCDYTLAGDGSAAMLWGDGKQLFTVSGDSGALSQLYLDALDLGGWESCRYIAGEEARLSFGTVSAQRCETLQTYVVMVKAAMELQSFANAITGITRSYVLNKRSKKFHFPECPGIRNMSIRNREDFTGTREALIARGYSPCGICKP